MAEFNIDKMAQNVAKRAMQKLKDNGVFVSRWIPVSERLPEEDSCYLVTTTGMNNDIIDIAYYMTGLWHKASRIKAWMPLPEPYKGGEQE